MLASQGAKGFSARKNYSLSQPVQSSSQPLANNSTSSTLASELEQQQLIPNSIVIKPTDYPDQVINDTAVREIEEAINNIVEKSQGQIDLNSVIIEQVKFGVMFVKCKDTHEANKLATLISSFPWTRFGLPSLQCISVRNFNSAPVCEIRIGQKGKSFDEVKLAAQNMLNVSTSEWRLIKKLDAPSRRGSSFIFVCDKDLQENVQESPRGEIKFNFGFSHLKATISIPPSYKLTRKSIQPIIENILEILAFKAKLETNPDSTSPSRSWITSFRTSFGLLATRQAALSWNISKTIRIRPNSLHFLKEKKLIGLNLFKHGIISLGIAPKHLIILFEAAVTPHRRRKISFTSYIVCFRNFCKSFKVVNKWIELTCMTSHHKLSRFCLQSCSFSIHFVSPKCGLMAHFHKRSVVVYKIKVNSTSKKEREHKVATRQNISILCCCGSGFVSFDNG